MQTGILSLFLSLCMIFSSTGGIKSANLKQAELTSYTTQGTLSIELTSEIDEETKNEMKPFNLQSVFNALSDFKMAWGGNVILDKTSFETEATSGIVAPDMNFTVKTYEKMSEGNFETVLEIPTIYRLFLPEEYEDATYVSASSDDISNPTEEDLVNIKLINDLTNEIFKSMTDKDSLVYKFAEENKNIFSKKGSVYTIKLNDETVIGFAKAIALDFCDNEKSVQYIKSLANYIKPILKSVYPGNEMFEEIIMTLDMAESLDEAALQAAKIYITEFFADLDDIEFFEENGLTINVKMTDKGYIENINMSLDVSFDLTETMSYSYDDDAKFIIDALITYNNDFSNFNKIEKIEKPKNTKENTVSVKDWLTVYYNEIEEQSSYEDYEYTNEDPDYIGNIELPAADGSVKYFFDDYLIDFGEHKPIVVNGIDYVELTAIDYALSWGYEYQYRWDNETKTMYVTDWYETYSFKINTDVIYYDQYAIKLAAPIIDVNGVCYVPLKTYIKAVHNSDCYWDPELRSIIINW